MLGFVRSAVVTGAVLFNFLAVLVPIAVLAGATEQGNDVIIPEDEVVGSILFLALGLIGNLVLAIILLVGHFRRPATVAAAPARPSSLPGFPPGPLPDRALQCPRCGAFAPLDAQFCPNCGLPRTTSASR